MYVGEYPTFDFCILSTSSSKILVSKLVDILLDPPTQISIYNNYTTKWPWDLQNRCNEQVITYYQTSIIIILIITNIIIIFFIIIIIIIIIIIYFWTKYKKSKSAFSADDLFGMGYCETWLTSETNLSS